MVDPSLSSPHVSDTDKPLRRAVAMAYRTALEAGRSHHAALDTSKAVYNEARPEAMGDPLAASARINEMIASAIRVDPVWFWKNVRALIESGQLSSGPMRDPRTPEILAWVDAMPIRRAPVPRSFTTG